MLTCSQVEAKVGDTTLKDRLLGSGCASVLRFVRKGLRLLAKSSLGLKLSGFMLGIFALELSVKNSFALVEMKP